MIKKSLCGLVVCVLVLMGTKAWAICWLTVDGVEETSTQEIGRTLQAAEEVYYKCLLYNTYGVPDPVPGISGNCVYGEDDLGILYQFAKSVCIDGFWYTDYVCMFEDPKGCGYSQYREGTWDVVCIERGVPDTGDSDERACNQKTYTNFLPGIYLTSNIMRDSVTGLDWVHNGNLMASRNPSFDADGTAGDGAVTWQHALDYIDLLNAENYHGYSDWRLPTIKELSTLVDADRSNPAIDPVFSNTASSGYWSETEFSFVPLLGWNVDFYNGGVLSEDKSSNLYVRPVRGASYGSANSFVDNGDGTITDETTDLMWQQCNNAQTWDGSACVDSGFAGDWQQPVEYIEGLNACNYLGYSDWRLPTRNELQSLMVYSLYNPASTFPGLPALSASHYWSSTSLSGSPWYVDFTYGTVDTFIDSPAYTRAVRGGLCDAHPVIADGPFLAAGTWPLLQTDPDSPINLDQDVSVLWTFSDDYASCDGGACTYTAEYQAVGDSTWTALAGDVDLTSSWYAGFKLQMDDLTNATTYAIRFTVTDCANQSTTSDEYYFRVAVYDDPPVIGDGPFVASGAWPVLTRGLTTAPVLTENTNILWTFSDDYATCDGACTHRARIRKVGDPVNQWTALSVSTDPSGEWYAYAGVPVTSLTSGTYAFRFDVQDCALQRTYSLYYYFKVE